MADPNDRNPAADANRARMQGVGAGQRDMDAGRDPSRHQTATNPEQRSFDRALDGATNADRPTEADFGEAVEADGQGEAPAERREGWGLDPNVGRNEAGLGDVGGDLGAGTPANVDIHKLGQDDRPQEYWGEAAGSGATYSSNHNRRPVRTEAERGQGRKTRQANKDIVSRRS